MFLFLFSKEDRKNVCLYFSNTTNKATTVLMVLLVVVQLHILHLWCAAIRGSSHVLFDRL